MYMDYYWLEKWTYIVNEPNNSNGNLLRLKENVPQHIRDKFDSIVNAYTRKNNKSKTITDDTIYDLNKYITAIDNGFNLDLDRLVNDLASGDHKIDFTRIAQESFFEDALLYDLSTFTCCGENIKWIPSKHIAYIAIIAIDAFEKELFRIYKDDTQYHDIKKIMLKREDLTSEESDKLRNFLNDNKQFNWFGDSLYCGAYIHNRIRMGSKIKFNKEVLRFTYDDEIASEFIKYRPRISKAVFRIDKLNSPAIVNIFNLVQMEVISMVGDVTFEVVDIDDENIDDAVVYVLEEV